MFTGAPVDADADVVPAAEVELPEELEPDEDEDELPHALTSPPMATAATAATANLRPR